MDNKESLEKWSRDLLLVNEEIKKSQVPGPVYSDLSGYRAHLITSSQYSGFPCLNSMPPEYKSRMSGNMWGDSSPTFWEIQLKKFKLPFSILSLLLGFLLTWLAFVSFNSYFGHPEYMIVISIVFFLIGLFVSSFFNKVLDWLIVNYLGGRDLRIIKKIEAQVEKKKIEVSNLEETAQKKWKNLMALNKKKATIEYNIFMLKEGQS